MGEIETTTIAGEPSVVWSSDLFISVFTFVVYTSVVLKCGIESCK